MGRLNLAPTSGTRSSRHSAVPRSTAPSDWVPAHLSSRQPLHPIRRQLNHVHLHHLRAGASPPASQPYSRICLITWRIA